MSAFTLPSRLFFLLVVSGFLSCTHVRSQSNLLSRRDAEKTIELIQPGMTLQDVRYAIPQRTEDIVLVTHGGLILAFRLSQRYEILLRLAHPPEGRPDDHLISNHAAYTRLYEHSRVNYSPTLCEDGKVISKPGGPW